MSSTTVAEFANELKKTPEILLDQLKSAGVPKAAATDALTEADKQRLLGFLKASHGTVDPERKKITLTKKSTTEITGHSADDAKALILKAREHWFAGQE